MNKIRFKRLRRPKRLKNSKLKAIKRNLYVKKVKGFQKWYQITSFKKNLPSLITKTNLNPFSLHKKTLMIFNILKISSRFKIRKQFRNSKWRSVVHKIQHILKVINRSPPLQWQEGGQFFRKEIVNSIWNGSKWRTSRE